MTMTRKDFKSIAQAIKENTTSDRYGQRARIDKDGLLRDISLIMSANNPRFDRTRFYLACKDIE